MQQSTGNRNAMAPAVIGVLLIVVGAVALGLRQFGTNILPSLGEWGWPFFVIVPGVVLLGLSLVPAPPRGIGFAIAGAIVTTVGALLLYQSRSGHWESWAYAWALIPASVGVAMTLYGLLARTPGMVTSGVWMAAIAATLFGVGAWFFEGIFAGEERFLDAGNWWPVAVIAVGAVIVLASILRPRAVTEPPRPAEPPTPSSPRAG